MAVYFIDTLTFIKHSLALDKGQTFEDNGKDYTDLATSQTSNLILPINMYVLLMYIATIMLINDKLYVQIMNKLPKITGRRQHQYQLINLFVTFFLLL